MKPNFTKSDHLLLLGSTGLFGTELLQRFFNLFEQY